MQKLWRAHARYERLSERTCLYNPQSREIIETLNRLSSHTHYVRTYIVAHHLFRWETLLTNTGPYHILSQNIRNGCVLICNPNVIYISGQRVLRTIHVPTNTKINQRPSENIIQLRQMVRTHPRAHKAHAHKKLLRTYVEFFFPQLSSRVYDIQ